MQSNYIETSGVRGRCFLTSQDFQDIVFKKTNKSKLRNIADRGFPTPALPTIWSWSFLAVGAFLCTAGCLAAPRASTQGMQEQPPLQS